MAMGWSFPPVIRSLDSELAPRNVTLSTCRSRSPIFAIRRNAATNSLASLARITPRLAESPSGFNTQGYGARAANAAGSSDKLARKKAGTRIPAA